MLRIARTVGSVLPIRANITTIKVWDAASKFCDIATWFRIAPSQIRTTATWLRITASRTGITAIWHYIAEIEFSNTAI